MKKILIRPTDIKKCWETEDACIVEQYDGKKWICEKFFYSSVDCNEWNTVRFVYAFKDEDIIELLLKGKSESDV